MSKSWEILRRILEKSFENFLWKTLVFLKKNLRMFLEKFQFFLKNYKKN